MQDYTHIPDMLKTLPRWVCFRMISNKKVPITPKNGLYARVDDDNTWGTFEEAVAEVKYYSGIGFMLGDGIIGIDLDHVIENGQLSDDAKAIMDKMDTYTEISPSGTGLHMIAIGKLPEGERRSGFVEMYDNRRFFTMTGNVWDKTRQYEVAERTAAATEIHGQYLSQRTVKAAAAEPKAPAQRPTEAAPVTAGPGMADTVERVIELASKAQNGERFQRLFSGDLSGYDTPSQADLALCDIAAFYAGDNAALIDGVFRASGLMRSKWDQRRGTLTYGEKTVQKAIEGTKAPAPRPERPKKQRTASKKASEPPAKPVNKSPGYLIKDSEQLLNKLPATQPQVAHKPVQVEGMTSMLDVAATLPGEFDELAPRISTGLLKLDRQLDGGMRSGLYVLGAEATIGKTTLALNMALSAAWQGSPVLYVSYEQSADRLCDKLVNALNPDKLELNDDHRKQLSMISVPSRDADLSLTGLLAQLERFLKQCQAQRSPLPMVVVDYLQAVSMKEQTSARQAIDCLVSGLRGLLQRYDVCILAISSLSRSAYMVPVRRDSFKESGGIEYAADVIFGLQLYAVTCDAYQALLRDERSTLAERTAVVEHAMKEQPRSLTLTVLKNRDGAIGYKDELIFSTARDRIIEA